MEPFEWKALDFLALLLFCLQPFHGQSNSDPLHYNCSVDYYIDPTKFEANLQGLLTSLVDSGPTNGFFNNTIGEYPTQIYGLVLCRADVNTKTCRNCLQTASDYIQKSCFISQSLSAILWYEKCLLRYSNNDFFGVADTDGFFMYNSLNKSEPQEAKFLFWGQSGSIKDKQKVFITSLVENAPTKPLFYEAKNGRSYSVVQCTRDLTARTCRNCLMTLTNRLESCCYGKKTWRYLAQSCGIWYDYRYFTSTDLRNILVSLGSVILGIMLCIGCCGRNKDGGGATKHTDIPSNDNELRGVSMPTKENDDCEGGTKLGGGATKSTDISSKVNKVGGSGHRLGEDISLLINKNEVGGGENKVGGISILRNIPSKGKEVGGGVSMPTSINEVGGGGNKVGGVSKPTNIPSKGKEVGGGGTKLGGGVSMPTSINEVGGGENKVGGVSKPTDIPSKGKEGIPSKGKEVGGGGNKLGEGVSMPTSINEVGGGGNKDGGVSKPPNLPSKGNEVEGGGNKLGGRVSKSTDKNEVGGGGNKDGGISKPPNIPSKGNEAGGENKLGGSVSKPTKKNEVGGGVNKDIGVSKLLNISSKGNEVAGVGNKHGGGGDGDNVVRTLELRCVDISVLTQATESFSDANMLGEGGFGVVYKGKLNDGMEVAVKKLRSTGRRPKDFEREVQSLAEIQHRNVVKLYYYCIDREDYYLVYEYIPNKSLAYNLFDKTSADKLDTTKRRSIIQGIAKGIRYLHEESRVIIIHRDLKPENILLDNNMNPKIADFGNAKIFSDQQIEVFVSDLVVTRGYMPREYLLGGEYSRATDVFSFGVLLIEIISGERNCSFHNLLAKAWNLWRRGKHIEFVDPVLIESCSTEDARQEIEKKSLRWIHVGLLCVQGDPNPRPTITEVLHMLEGDSAIDVQPTKPPIEYATKYATKSSLPPIIEPPFNEVTSESE